MLFLSKKFLFSLLVLAAAFSIAFHSSAALAEDFIGTFRHMSVAIRDKIPTATEARDFENSSDKSSKLDEYITTWLASSDHDERVKRHFNDMFGISPGIFIADVGLDLIQYNVASPDEAPSDLSTAGVYHLPVSIKPTCGTPVSATAWWSESPITICPTAVSTDIQFSGGTIRCSDTFGVNGMRNAICGCGPKQILCYPRQLKANIVVGVAREFAERGNYVYKQGLSWTDLFGGDKYYGDRWLFHHYLWQEKVGAALELPSAGESAFLESLPLTTKSWAAFPTSSVIRSGVVTSPAFLRRFNNFRSRVRAITENLLCKDVDGSLNIDGYAQFLNPDLSAFDRSHGSQESCASCHYSLDNFGSTLLGWSPDGFYEKWSPKSLVGHVCGMDGTGPRFLMNSYINHASGFAECMAKKTWENFSGAGWADISTAEQSVILSAANAGPRQVIQEVLSGSAIKNVRLNKSLSSTTVGSVVYRFNEDINPILAKSCAGSSCHSSGNPRGQSSTYVDSEVSFKKAPASRISSGSMPPPGSGFSLTAEERNSLLIFIGQ